MGFEMLRNGLFALFASLFWGEEVPQSQVSHAHFQVTPQVVTKNVPRIGVNLGHWTSWGAEQFCNNVIMNPGFEGIIDRAIVVINHATAYTFADNADWLGRADGFWAGARFDVRTGPYAGYTGSLVDSRSMGQTGFPEFTTRERLPSLMPGDVIVLTKTTDTELPSQWYLPPHSKQALSVDLNNTRPKSTGSRSLVMTPVGEAPVEIIFYLDAIGERAGKLLPIDEPWQLSFWCQATSDNASLDVQVVRQGSVPFFDKTVYPNTHWQKYTFSFSANDTGPDGMIGLHFLGLGGGSKIFLDDVSMGPTQPGTFRPKIVEALKKLNPGYLRDWTYQLADNLENRIADPFSRRATRSMPGDLGATHFVYALPEFIDLCREVNANPWIIIPTTFSDHEFINLGRWLSQNILKDEFSEVMIEFGNENWNALFRSVGIQNPVTHGEVAQRAFRLIKKHSGHLPLKTVVNGQYVHPEYALQFAHNAPDADMLSVAPYFFYELEDGASSSENLMHLFADDGSYLRQSYQGTKKLQKELVVYEVNLHTTKGHLSSIERDGLTAGAASGTALAHTLLRATKIGVRRQCVYTLAGFDAWLDDRSGHARLWGLYRDFGPTQRLRPTGIALSLINQIIVGDLHHVKRLPGGASDVDVYAFKLNNSWSVAALSRANEPRQVIIDFDRLDNTQLPTDLHMMHFSNPISTNEDGENVTVDKSRIYPESNRFVFSLQAYGLATLTPLFGDRS